MATEVDKDSDEPIHFSEAYRRAKRNALFWAAIGFLLPFGHTERGTFEAPFARDLEFDHRLLVALALGVLVFMAVGFLRAEREVRLRNSHFVIKGRLSGVAGMFDDLRVKAGNAEREINAAVNEAAAFRDSARQQSTQLKTFNPDAFAQRFNRMQIDNDPTMLAIVNKLHTGESLRQSEVADLNNRMVEIATEVGTKYENMVNSSIYQALNAVSGDVPDDSDLLSIDSKVVAALDGATREIAKLRDFSARLDSEDLAWHRKYDHLATWLAVAIGGGWSIGFLIAKLLVVVPTPLELLARFLVQLVSCVT